MKQYLFMLAMFFMALQAKADSNWSCECGHDCCDDCECGCSDKWYTGDYTYGGLSYTLNVSKSDDSFYGWATLNTGNKYAKGYADIPDSIYYRGHSYSVDEVAFHAFEGNKELTGIRLPNTLKAVGEYAFMKCSNLRSVHMESDIRIIGGSATLYVNHLDTLHIHGAAKVLYNSDFVTGIDTIGNIIVEDIDTAVFTWTCIIDHCHFGNISHVILAAPPFGNYVFNHFSEIGFSLKSMTIESPIPPQVEVSESYKSLWPKWEEWNKLCWTVLFVPDGSEELYRNAEFWKDFHSIYPISEYDKADEYKSLANKDFEEWKLAVMDVARADVTDYTINGNILTLKDDGNVKMVDVYDVYGRTVSSGRYAGGMPIMLPQGISIVSVDRRNHFKVCVK